MSLTNLSRGQSHKIYSASAIATTDTANATDSVPVANALKFSAQCVWADVTGTQPVFKIQTSNDGTNYDDVSGATYTTTTASGSATIHVNSTTARYARMKISTASSAGSVTTYFAVTEVE